jgi:endonuclease/exonuclease/phosphatase family metal-dependent hydrolase
MASSDSAAVWRLATFNLESLDERSSDPAAFEARIAALRPMLAALNADVLCLQEVNAQGHGGRKPRKFSALDHLLAETIYQGFHRAHSVNPKSGKPADVHNLVTLSRWPITTHSQLFHTHVPVWTMPALPPSQQCHEIRFDRPALVTEIAAPFGPLHVFNLHLRAPRASLKRQTMRQPGNAEWAESFHVAALKRQGQAFEVRVEIDRLLSSNSKEFIAVCGDLNADAYETPARLLRGTPDEGDDVLTAGQMKGLGEDLPETRRYSVIHNGRKVMLDHIFVSPALARSVVSIAALNEHLPDEVRVEAPVPGSLHAPVVAEFRPDGNRVPA